MESSLYYAELGFCKFSVHFAMPSFEYLIGKYWILARSECLMESFDIIDLLILLLSLSSRKFLQNK